MALKKYKPTSPGRRFMATSSFEEVTKAEPEKSLLEPLTKTGTCLRPSWTAIVCPTISGKMVDVRDQVRIMRFSPVLFIASIRLSSRSWMKGPFFDDLDMT